MKTLSLDFSCRCFPTPDHGVNKQRIKGSAFRTLAGRNYSCLCHSAATSSVKFFILLFLFLVLCLLLLYEQYQLTSINVTCYAPSSVLGLPLVLTHWIFTAVLWSQNHYYSHLTDDGTQAKILPTVTQPVSRGTGIWIQGICLLSLNASHYAVVRPQHTCQRCWDFDWCWIT